MNVYSEKRALQEANLERIKEMKMYGRIKTYKRINSLLKKDLREGFILTNHALAIVDDSLDNEGGNLSETEKVFSRSFNGEDFKLNNEKLRKIQRLGYILRKLKINGFKNAQKIYLEIINYWKIDVRDRSRRFKILSAKDLDNLNKQIGASVGKQFLYFLTPNLDLKTISLLAVLYGRAIKYADNLSDLNDDLNRGYINISKEDIKKYKLFVSMNSNGIKVMDLNYYKKAELKRVEKMFKKAYNKMMKVSSNNHNYKEMLTLFNEVSESWLKQARELAK